jgi:hypothetical protein
MKKIEGESKCEAMDRLELLFFEIGKREVKIVQLKRQIDELNESAKSISRKEK